MIYRKKPSSYVARLTSVKEAIEQFDSPGEPLVELPSNLITQIRGKYLWFEPLYHARIDTATAVFDRIRKRNEAFERVRRNLSTVLHSFQNYVWNDWIKKEERRTYFNLNPEGRGLGIPVGDKEIIVYAEYVLGREAQRRKDGCRPIYDDQIEALKENLKLYEETLDEVRQARNAYFRVQVELMQHIGAFDELIRKLWNTIDAGLSDLPRSTRRQIAMQFGVRFVVRKGSEEPVQPSDEDLQEDNLPAGQVDPLFPEDTPPGEHPDDDLGVEDALRAIGMLDESEQNAEGGVRPADE